MKFLLAFLIPSIFLLSFVFAIFRKVRVYDSFTEGVKGAIPLILSVFPYIATVTILSKLLEMSGVSAKLALWLSPVCQRIGVPKEILPLVLIKPLSGSGAIAVISDILDKYGADSYISRCACVIYGSSETIFYIGAVYFSGVKRKKLNIAMGIAVFTYLLSVGVCCLLCRIL